MTFAPTPMTPRRHLTPHAKAARLRMPDNAPFKNCPTCGTPQVPDAHCLVLYFPSVEDCKEAAVALKEALPTATSYVVDR